ncbi:beta-galactosidase family protein [Microbacterium sp. MPKO10]|uniref:glycoside hydrolase family 35 protein n=1 Tax=Microbacterium sp. MPKO10 TaxID=2989818 RepID=UPI0022369AE3|nr:beta-galactosidase family protein [Microbacterium sp. MPKO10]MCW4458670.1 beta-galactosidase [Microbacterium sp. MPKO10]
MSRFEIGDRDFVLDGEPVQILSGALHYFRVHPDQWADRIEKARQMGLNTIETYIAWNQHAATPGEFDLTGGLDLDRFLTEIADAGMHAIVRPGPYICAEWDNGGLPAWLLRDDSIRIRTSDRQYMGHVSAYFDHVLPIVAAHQIDNGGPVVLVQIENEYGAYGDDAEYLRELVALTRAHGITVPFTTVDQPEPQMLENGSIPGLHKTGSFGSRVAERLQTLREHQPTGPLMCSEFWNGWFDHWGAHHHTTSAPDAANELDALLAAGASVNVYMFHGGTNFGFTNGANDKGVYQPTVTSYDYDAPLDEAGNRTEKYWAFRDVIAKYAPVPADVPAAASAAPVFDVSVERVAPLLPLGDALVAQRGAPAEGVPTFDDLGHDRGFGLYTASLAAGSGPRTLAFAEVRDRARVFWNGRPIGTLSRDQHDDAVVVPAEAGTLELLVEDQGRVNYGERLGEAKGLIGPATLDGVAVDGWELRAIDAHAIPGAAESAALFEGTTLAGPAMAHARFEITEPRDLFLDLSGWGKGVAWVNGFNLGRYWRRGPQRTLYVPGSSLRVGENTVTVFEVDAAADPVIRFVSGLDLGHTDY